MPGTIHVSVLGFSDLPPSSPSSSILIKASMGKRDHQAWGKGDFSFPLTTLRDNVIITLQDAKGNEISYAGIQAMSIAEKGSWDEFLPLEGGGIVHFKLQFVLNEEERNRIQRMRESAMKRKREELLGSSLRYSEPVSTVGRVPPSFCANHEVSEPDEGIEIHRKETTTANYQLNERDGSEDASLPVSIAKGMDLYFKDESCNLSNEKIETSEETHGRLFEKNERDAHLIDASNILIMPKVKKDEEPLQKTPSNVGKMDETAGSEDDSTSASVSKGMDVHDQNLKRSDEKICKLVEKNDKKLHHVDIPKRPIIQEDVSLNMKKNLILSDAKKDREVQVQKLEPLRKTPSNVKKMISAFESSLPKNARPGIKPPPTKPQPDKVSVRVPEDLIISETMKMSSDGLKHDIQNGKLQQMQEDGSKIENFGNEDIPTAVLIQVKETETISEQELRTPETISGSVHEENSGLILNQPLNFSGKEEDFGGNVDIGRPKSGFRQVKETESISEQDLRTPKTVSRSMHEENYRLIQNQPVSLFGKEEDFGGNADIGRPKAGIHVNNSHETNIRKSLENELKSAVLCVNECSSLESSEAWIFADRGTRVCVTTERKQVIDVVGGCKVEESVSNETKRFSLSENLEKQIRKSGIYSEVKKSDTISPELRKSSLESSSGVGTSTGPFGQAIRIAIMVAFGTLVLITRQRKPR